MQLPEPSAQPRTATWGTDTPTPQAPTTTPPPNPAGPVETKGLEAPARAGTPSVDNQDRITGPVSIKNVLDLGMSFLGRPYVWGGSNPKTGFDCSGLLQYIYAQNGVSLPRVSRDQARVGRAVTPDEAQPGDLIAFDNSAARPGVDHIGVYLGGGKMLQAPRTGKNIEVVNVNLARATTIRRVVPDRYAVRGMPLVNGKAVYKATVTPGATKPTAITPDNGGGDDPQLTMSSDGTLLGPDGKPDPAAAIAQYGYVAELAKTVPDIKRVIAQAIEMGIDPNTSAGQARFQAMLSATAWWKNTQVNKRKNDVLKVEDPQAWREKRQGFLDKIVIVGRQAGVPQDNKAIEKMADKAMAQGWSDEQITRYVALEVKVSNNSSNSGKAAITVDTLKTQAADWMVPLSDATLQTWTRQILSGDVPLAAFESYLKTQAKSLMPALADDIDRGVTVKQYIAPYAEYAGQILERDPNTIDFLHDPKMSKALFSVDPKTSQRVPMSLADWQTYLRGLPEYGNTSKAKQTSAEFAQSLAATFGKVA